MLRLRGFFWLRDNTLEVDSADHMCLGYHCKLSEDEELEDELRIQKEEGDRL